MADKPESYLKHDTHPEEKDVELSRKASYATLKKMEKQSETWEKQLGAETEKEGDEKFKEKVRELWKQLAVHGAIERDKEGKVTIKNFTDLDGKSAIGILKLAGIKGSDIEYINPGTFKKGKTNIDTGRKHGFEVVEDEDGTVTIIGDHHHDESGRDTSATKIFYETMLSLGMVEKTQALEKLVEFVTQIDNKTFLNEEKYFKDSWRTVLGLQRYFNFANLLKYFESGKSPTDILTVDELFKYRLDKPALKQEKIVETSLAEMERTEKEGLIIPSQRYGRIVVDIGKKVPSGIDAAKYFGCETYINWNPDKNGFFITSPDRGVTDTFSQGRNIRKGMYMKPLADTNPLTLTLGEVLNKMTDGKLRPTGLLQKYLLSEKKPDAIVEAHKTPEMAKEIEPQKPGNPFESFVEELKDKLSVGDISLEEMRAKQDLLEKAAASDDPGEFFKDALSEGKINLDEFNKLKPLISPKEKGVEFKINQPEPTPEPSPIPEKTTKEQPPVLNKESVDEKKELTLEEIEKNLRYAKDTARIFETAHWQAEREKYLKEHGEGGKEGVGKKFGGLVRGFYDKFLKREEVTTLGLGPIPFSKRASPPPLPPEMRSAQPAPEKRAPEPVERAELVELGDIELDKEKVEPKIRERGFSLWKWTKERFKSMAEIPVRGELKQAEAMRFGTKYAAGLAEAYATLIQNEKRFTAEETKDGFNAAVKKRVEQNDDQISRTVIYVTNILKERFAKARGQATAESVLNDGKIKEIQDRLRYELEKLRYQRIDFDTKEFARFLRENLDKYWWLRYGYALAEALAARKIVAYIAGKISAASGFKTQIFDTGSDITAGEEIGPATPEDLAQVYMNPGENPWTISKKIADQVGLNNPTPEQLQEIDVSFVKQNGIEVSKWDIPGATPDTKLPPGWYYTNEAVETATDLLNK